MKPIFTTAFVLMFCSSSIAQSGFFEMSQIGDNHSLQNPWEILYGPDGKLWLTERVGKTVKRVDPVTGEQDVLLTISEATAEASAQDGLLGMALHPQLGEGEGLDYVYLSYTYLDNGRKQKLVRYTYSVEGDDGTLSDPVDLITDMPASNDHNAGRLLYGPDNKLYYTIGDQGKNQYANKCQPIVAQEIPTQEEVDVGDWRDYQGKTLRLNIDGGIPEDNPWINGVRSHIYSYGHRNPQGLAFGPDGRLFSAEHGPKSDDEVNLIVGGKNYGWPHVAGHNDDMAYEYCNWSTASDCNAQPYSEYDCPSGAETAQESGWSHPDFMAPLTTFYTVADDYNFFDPSCSNLFICWPTIAPSSIDYYGSDAIPGWENSLLVVSLKKGRVYRLKLSEDGDSVEREEVELWYTQNRYRDIAIAPDGRSFFIITDNTGQTSGPSGGNTGDLANPGAILKFEYTGSAVAVTEPSPRRGALEIYPNPVGDYLHVGFPEDAGKMITSVQVSDPTGKKAAEFSGFSREVNMSVNHLKSGLYFIKAVTADGLAEVEKIVVRH